MPTHVVVDKFSFLQDFHREVRHQKLFESRHLWTRGWTMEKEAFLSCCSGM
uniref:ATP-dependent zinc metalloprotease FTSH 2ic-like n=1 Tax=Rhizophora mucronata TaxID=61149 RepID=A0A2P2IKM2_RHIMU